MSVSVFGSLLISMLATLAPGAFASDKIQRLASRPCFHHTEKGETVYQFNLTDIFDSEEINFSRYEEPGSNASEILNGVRFVRPGKDFIPNFQIFKKSDVNGKDELPLYTYLKSYCPTTRDGFEDKKALYWDPIRNNDVKWNWEKFLITRRGYPHMRYDPSTEPEAIRADIEFLLQNDI